MKAVLISIQPKWCEKIFNGEKTIEVRKSRPKIDTPFKCYIYQTKKNAGLKHFDQDSNKLNDFLILRKCGKVIGEFICDKVDAYTFSNYEAQYRINDVDLMKTCLNFPELIAYGKGKDLYGWHISDLKIYDKPRELGEFRKLCVDEYQYCQGCRYGNIVLPPDEEEYALYHGGSYENFDVVCQNRLTRPPQSWCYIEV